MAEPFIAANVVLAGELLEPGTRKIAPVYLCAPTKTQLLQPPDEETLNGDDDA